MKKIFTAFLFIFSVVPIFAQPVTQVTDKENLRQTIALMFQREQEAYTQNKTNALKELVSARLENYGAFTSYPQKPSASYSEPFLPPTTFSSATKRKQAHAARTGKQWQIAMFLAAADRPFGETLGTVRWLVKNGYIRRAALANIPKKTAKRNVTLYFVYMSDNKTITDTVEISVDIKAKELLLPLFQGLKTETELYNGIIVDAHGSGMEMFFGSDGEMTPKELLESLQESRLTADILNLNACHMASFYTVYQIARYKNVKYLLASSDFMYASNTSMYYLLLRNLQFPPETAAVNTTRQMKQLFEFNPNFSVNNSIAINLQLLHSPAENWFTSYGVLLLNSQETLKNGLEQAFDPRFGEFRSLHKIIRKQLAFLESYPEAEAEFSNQECYNWDEQKLTFIQNSRVLVDALNASLLTQWCYSPQTDTVYSDRIPTNIDCSDGISVTKEQINTLLEENKNTFQEKDTCNSKYLWII